MGSVTIDINELQKLKGIILAKNLKKGTSKK